ncbi:hypothetical protein Tco_1294131 [Tanacetum coccineum]
MDHVKSILTTVEADMTLIRSIRSSQYAVSSKQNSELAHTKLTVELADRTVKYQKGIAENVLVGIELRRDQVNDLMPTIEECKVSEKDENNGISHAYQKLKGFYKGVLNLGPDYIRDAKMEEWLTRGHISVHDME